MAHCSNLNNINYYNLKINILYHYFIVNVKLVKHIIIIKFIDLKFNQSSIRYFEYNNNVLYFILQYK